MNGKIRLGFIGAGMMGRNHIDEICRHFASQAVVTAICDANTGELEKAGKLAPEAKKFFKWQELLEENMDGVIISTPNFTHAEIAITALAAGRHVLSEKPVATTRKDCKKMILAAKKSRKTLMIGHELRYSPYFSKIKELLDADIIGQPRLVWCKEFRMRFLPKIDNWMQDRRRSGGALVDKNCHHFDLMNWYLNLTPAVVSAFGGNDVVKVIGNQYEIEDNATVIVDYENKARATLLLCMFAPWAFHEQLEFGLFGERGFLGTAVSKNEIVVIQREHDNEIEWMPDRSCKFKRKGNDTITYHVQPPRDDYGGHNGFMEEHQAFLDAIITGRKPLTEINNCVYGSLIPIAAEEAMRQRRQIRL